MQWSLILTCITVVLLSLSLKFHLYPILCVLVVVASNLQHRIMIMRIYTQRCLTIKATGLKTGRNGERNKITCQTNCLDENSLMTDRYANGIESKGIKKCRLWNKKVTK